MDLFVLPTHSDMSSYAAVEAAALGLPAVVSSIGGIAEVVADGVTGFLPAKDDDAGFVAAVDGLLASPELRRRMGQAALARFDQQLNARVVGDRLVDRLVALSSGRPGRSGSRQ